MSTDFASSRVFPDPLYKLRVECDREIDFDFFDDAPSAPTTPSWRSQGTQRDSRTTLGDSEADGGVLDNGNVPSPMLVAGPTPVDGRSALSSCVSLTASLGEDGTQSRAGTRCSSLEDVVEDVAEDVKSDSEVHGEHADEGVVVGRVARPALNRPAGEDAHPEELRPGLPPSEQQRDAQHDAASADDGTSPGCQDAVLENDAKVGEPEDAPSGNDGDPRPVLEGPASPASAPSSSSSFEYSEDSDAAEEAVEDVEEAEDAEEDEDVEEAEAEEASFGIQELSLTVSHKPHHAASSLTVSSLTVSSMTVSSMTAVSGMTRRDSAGDSDPEDAYTMEAIKKALRRARPPSSTGSLPVMATASASRSGRSRRLNMSFSNDDARRIQRENELLLRRIVGQRGRQSLFGPQPAAAANPRVALARASPAPPAAHRCSHAVNRARRGKDIEHDNQILLKKIQSVKRSPSQLSLSRSSSAMSGRYSYG